MALWEKLRSYHEKCVEGHYDLVLRSLPIFPAVPAIILVAIDLDRYQKNSALHHVQSRKSLTIDALALAFTSLLIVLDLVFVSVRPYRPRFPILLAAMDFILSNGMLALADSIFSKRTAGGVCIQPLGECSASAHSIMGAAAGMLIIAS
jgi:hypothetical protein